MKYQACFVALVLAPSVAIGAAYSCKGADGSMTFSQSPCGKNSREIELKQIRTTGASPNVDEISEAARVQREHEAAIAEKELANPTPPIVQAPEAFRCQVANGEVFYRHDRCPQSVEVPSTSWIGNRAITGTHFAPVESSGVSKRVACEKIRNAGNRAGTEFDQSYDGFARRSGNDPCGY